MFISIISNYNSFSLRVCINLIECQYLRRLRGDAILEINQQINKSKYFLWCWMAIYIEMCTLHLSFNIQVHVHLIRYFSNCFSHMLTNCCTRHFILKFEIDKVVWEDKLHCFSVNCIYRYFLHSHINHNWINGRLFIDKSDIIISTKFIPVQQTSLDSHKSSYSLVQSDAFVFFILFSESLHTNDRMSMNGLVYQAYCQRLHWSWTGRRPISDEVFTVCR